MKSLKRSRGLKLAAILILFTIPISLFQNMNPVTSDGRNVIEEFNFKQAFYGFKLGKILNVDERGCPAEPRHRDNPEGSLRIPTWETAPTHDPIWGIGEMYSSDFLVNADGHFVPNTNNSEFEFSNNAKSVRMGANFISLKTNGSAEYNNIWPPASSPDCVGRPHAHLMLSQSITSGKLADLTSMKLSATFQKGTFNLSANDPDPRSHSMHYRMNFILQNQCGSPECGHGQSVNLGFVIYDDNASRCSKNVINVEESSGEVLLRPPITAVPGLNGSTIAVFNNNLCGSASSISASQVDILPALKQALLTGWDESRRLAEAPDLIGDRNLLANYYRLVNINVGWENSSLYTGEIKLSNFSLVEKGRPTIAIAPKFPKVVAYVFWNWTPITWSSLNATSCQTHMNTPTGCAWTSLSSCNPGNEPLNHTHYAGSGIVNDPTIANYYITCSGPGGTNTASTQITWYPTAASPAPGSSPATNIYAYSFRANWVPVANAINYYTDVFTEVNGVRTYIKREVKSAGTASYLSVTGLSPSTTYTYQVRAVSQDGVLSMFSSPVILTTKSAP